MANSQLSKRNQYKNAYQYQYKDDNNKMVKATFPAIRKAKDSNMGVFLLVVGVILGVPAFGLSLSSLILLLIPGAGAAKGITAILTIPFLIGAVVCTINGMKTINRERRFFMYINVLKEKNYATIEKLAKVTKKSRKFVIEELQQMIDEEWFFEGYMDKQRTCFISSHDVYKEYARVEEAREVLEIEEEKKILQEKLRIEEERELLYNNPQGKQLVALLAEGEGYIQQIKGANEKILKVDFSNKLYALETVCTKIFEQVKKKPEKMPDIRRFMNYYLPTTLKLVNAYYEFDKQVVQGDNIIKSKREIESSIDQINVAFENLFDQLFKEEALDVSTDIEVLSTMLNQEGLLGSDFK